jgi:hypothetical protein
MLPPPPPPPVGVAADDGDDAADGVEATGDEAAEAEAEYCWKLDSSSS